MVALRRVGAGIAPAPHASSAEERNVLSSLVASDPESMPAFLFAHRDDSVLSAFAALSRSSGHALEVVVCGGRPDAGRVGPWDQASGFGSSEEAHEVRTGEHREACAVLGVRSLALDLVDDQYASGVSAQWGSTFLVAESHLRTFGARTLVTHPGHAWHPDHGRVACLASLLGERLGIPIVEVCDRPYVRCSDQLCGRIPGAGPDRRVTIRLSVEQWTSKRQVVACYQSQYPALRAAFGREWSSRKRLGWECYALRPGSDDTASGDYGTC
jgi:LmbE family N-acetylglucosaminyl deacetylase